MFGADALDWTSLLVLEIACGQRPRDQALQNMYAGYATVAGFRLSRFNEEIIAKFWVNLFGTAPDSAQKPLLDFKTQHLRCDEPDHQQGTVMADLIDFTMTGTAAALVRVRNRLSAAEDDQVRNRYRDRTGQHHRPQRGAEMPRAPGCSRSLMHSTRGTLPSLLLPRLRWVIEQNGIAPKATFDAASGELVVNGTEMLALTGCQQRH